MDANLKVKWLKALRSGEIQQARFSLRREHGSMCCLGVLCKVAGIDLDAIETREGTLSLTFPPLRCRLIGARSSNDPFLHER